jgi:hypothetical protein
MAENEDRSDIAIENNIATWSINSVGDIQGTYIGTFKFKCYLDPMEQIRANRDYRDMIGPNPLGTPEHESFLAYALTQLKYRIISSPPFWSSTQSVGGNLPDESIISEVLNASMDSEVKYRNQLKKRKTEALERAKKAAEKMLREQQGETSQEAEAKDEGAS